ncbi:MAG TPA: ABC transporter substrate-binding protein [Stellaceae bacterium]|nr:ABC transporter substrate-binding protein [Stellaceae bacterium]
MSPAFAAELPLVRVSIVPIFVVAPHVAADRLGYFTAEGIAVATQPVQGGTVGIPGLIGGSFDVLYSNSVSVMTALDRGIDLRIIAEGTRIPVKPPDPAALLQRKGGGLQSGKDLEGKTIGINARFDIQWLIAQAWIKQTGGDPGKVSYREVPLPSMLDALANGLVDAAVLVDPFLTVGLGDARFELLDWAQSKVMPGLPSSLWVVSGKVAETKADLVRAYVRGFLKGAEWVNAHLGDAEYLRLVASYTRTDEKLLARMVVSKQPLAIDARGLERLIALMKDNDLLKTDINIPAKIFAA